MNEIPPSLAADLADDVYDVVKKNAPIEQTISELQNNYSSIFNLSSSNIAHARTGGPGFIKCETAFGMMVYGTGPYYKNHAFVVLRGTKILGDALTDANFLLSNSSAGYYAHDGFNKAFQSLRSQLDSFIAGFGQHGTGTVHCIGHSLGGALATLCAEYLAQFTNKEIYLYSFGSPRVGLSPFADSLSKKLCPERIFRVYHRTDIVPCLPTWPFSHAPSLMAEMNDYFQPSPGKVPAAEWHGMDNYINTVGSNSWTQLRGKRFEPFDDKATEAWLNHKSPIHFNVTDLTRLDKAIWYVLRKCFSFLNISFNAIFNVANNFSIYDTVAYVLNKSMKAAEATAKAVSAIPSLIRALINKICILIGIKEPTEPSQNFIYKIFQILSARLRRYCKEAIDSTLKLQF